ncbi:zinc finger BED domain-containing protein [Engraulis encrasicolus]|uniref:zinc finger BED domain-containing protein n=1 Tax=Engraulis encrasicolus TaxID=184585 RepID=UPI002FCF00F4
MMEGAEMLEDTVETVLERRVDDVEVHNAISGILSAAAAVDGDQQKYQSADAEETTTTAMPSSRERSLVWSFFKKADDRMATCSLCQNQIQYFSSTSNLHRHLKNKHAAEFRELQINAGKEFESEVQGDKEAQESMEKFLEDIKCRLGDEEGDAPHTPAEEQPTSGGENGGDDASSDLAVADTSKTGEKPKKSPVWALFRKLDQRMAMCLLCRKRLQHFSSTGNLYRHLRREHPAHLAKLETHTTLQANKKGHMQMTGRTTHRVQHRERELRDALRLVQAEEGRCLEQQKVLQEKTRELQAEKEALDSERRALQEEAKTLQREKEEIRVEREKLHSEREKVERLKQSLNQRGVW